MIRIDPEFQSYIPALSAEEYQQLEANLVEDGCRDPIVLWGDVLVDGHNRFEICNRLGLPFETVAKDFPNREAAMDWMDAHQLGRRNLTPDARRLLLGRRYNRLKRSPTENLIQNAPKDQNDTSGQSTAEKLALEHGVSAVTVKRAGKFAEQVDADPALKAAVASGERVKIDPPRPAPSTPEPKREPNGLSGLSREGLEDEVIGLREENAELRTERDTLKAERDLLKAQLAEATADNQGAVIGKLQKQVQAANFKRDEAMAATKRMERTLKAAQKRVAELEQTPVEMPV